MDFAQMKTIRKPSCADRSLFHWLNVLMVTTAIFVLPQIVCASPPSPAITAINYPSSITIGSWATIEVTVRNNGGHSDDGGIIVSFPSLTSDSDVVNVADAGGSSSGGIYREKDYGDSIYRKGDCGSASGTASYALGEMDWLGTLSWAAGESKTFRVSVKPKATGTFYFYLRAALHNQEAGWSCPVGGSDYRGAPDSSSYTDQQNWPVERRSIPVVPPTGNITVTVQNQSGVPRSGAKVVRYQGGPIDEKVTDASGQVTWTNIPTGTYSFEAYYEGPNPFDTLGEYWATASKTVSSGGNTLTLRRDMPYAESFRIFRVSDNQELTGSSEIVVGTQVRLELTVRNKTSSSKSARVRTLLDRDQSASWDHDNTTGYQSIGGTSAYTFTTTFTPTQTGTYYKAVKTEVSPGGKTDAWNWGEAFKVVPPTGNLYVTVQKQDGVPRSGAKVVLYQGGSKIDERTTDGSGQVSPPWTALATGTYSLEAYYEGANPFDTLGELWATALVTVLPGSNNLTMRRDWPYAESFRIFKVSDNQELTGLTEIVTGTQVRVEVTVRNKTGSSKSTRVRTFLDRDQSSAWDHDNTTGYQSIGGTSAYTFTTTFTPTQTGTYYKAVKTEVSPGGKTDAWNWGEAFTVTPEDLVRSLFGEPISSGLPVTVFGDTYTIHTLRKSGAPPEETIQLPFNGTNPPANEEHLVTEPSLARLIIETWFFDQAVSDLSSEKQKVLEPIRDHYALDSWWRTAAESSIPGLRLFSKRKAERTTIGHVSLWAANEVFKALATGGITLFATTWSGLKEFYDLVKFDHYPPDKLRREVQALLLAQAASGGRLDVLEGLLTLANIPDLTLEIKLRDGWEKINKYNKAASYLHEARLATEVGNINDYTNYSTAFAKSVRALGVGLVIDLAEMWVLDGWLGWSTIDEEIQIAAWLSDAHCEGISVTAAKLVELANDITLLRGGSDSSPSSRATLSSAYNRFLYSEAHILWPVLVEHFAVQLAHLQRIHDNTIHTISSYVGASQENIDELMVDHDDAITKYYLPSKQEFEDFLISVNQAWVGYEGAISAIKGQHSDNPLQISQPEVPQVYINATTRVTIPCFNDYASPLTITSVGSGSGLGGILFSPGGGGTIGSGQEGNVLVDISVPANWFTMNTGDSQEVSLQVPLTWTVGTESFNRIFDIRVLVSSKGKFEKVVADKNLFKPGEIANLTAQFSGEIGTGSYIVVGTLLKPDGNRAALSWGIQEQGTAHLAFQIPSTPCGGFGVRVFLYEQLGEIIIPETIINHVFYVVPQVRGNLSALNISDVLVIYPSADAEAAYDIQGVLGIPNDRMLVVENYSVAYLEQQAQSHDTILIGGHIANPLVGKLTQQGKIVGTIGSDGDAIIEVVPLAFGQKEAVIIAGWRLMDTQVAGIGFLDTWRKVNWTLTVNISPSGSGTVTKNPNKNTYCPDEQVILTASPNLGYTFTTWSGDATGSANSTTITMNGNKNVTANFSQVNYTLNLSKTGNGSVKVNGTLQSLPWSSQFASGTQVQLEAVPDTGWSFSNWSGDLSGTQNPVTINMNGPKNITANFSGSNGTATRNLPDCYTPSFPLSVTITVSPSGTTQSYTVEDVTPNGWTVTNINESGQWDNITKKVKWFFVDHNTRTLTYQVTPPSGETGTKTFSGTASFDGVNIPVGGDSSIETGSCFYHPADTDHDWRITGNELTAYASAWKKGQNQDPGSYVSNAGMLWKKGETYHYSGGDPPGCWVSGGSSTQSQRNIHVYKATGIFVTGNSTATRDLPDCYTPSVPLTVTIIVTPSGTTEAYTVEDAPPNGWTGININENGEWDNVNKKVKWFFIDHSTRTLTYEVTPPTGETETKTFSGTASFDGTSVSIGGDLSFGKCVISETISTPSTPSGPTSGTIGTSYSYSTGGSSSSLTHPVKYRFDWGDGTYSNWLPVGTTGASKSWSLAGSYTVKAQAQCATDTVAVSNWSSGLTVTISVRPGGKADILWRNKSTGQNVVWLMDGVNYGSYAWLSEVADLNWEIFGTGDFNGDGKTDILWRNKSTGQNVVWFMNGATYSSYAELLQVPDTNWQIVGTGDFNGNGKTDILWRNKSTGQNVVWLMNGTTYSSYAELYQVTDTNWQIVGTGDFNSDGKVDILWRNKSTGQNVIWFMNGATYGSYAELPRVTDTNWEIVGTGDFNGDGKTDILWRNKTTGQNVLWFMNGITYSGYAELLQVTDTNWEIVGIFTSTITQQYTLTTSVNPSGAGTVSVNGQLYTGSLSFNSGTQVTLSASPSSGYTFSSWSGVDSSNGATAYVTMNGNRAVTANFTYIPVCNPPSITTQPQSKVIQRGQTVTLSVTAIGTAPLSYQWYMGASPNTENPINGAMSNSYTTPPLVPPLNLTMRTDYWVRVTNSCGTADSNTATITVMVPQQYTLTTSVNPSGAGTVSGAGTYDQGTDVRVTATPNPGYTFSFWSGDASGNSNPITITMDRNKNIAANFTLISGAILEVHIISDGTGADFQQCFTPNEKYDFLSTDLFALLYVKISNVPKNFTLGYSFCKPDGNLYFSSGDLPVASWQYSYVCLMPKLEIAGKPPASIPGTWRADYYYNDGTTTFSGSEYFTVSTENYLTLNDGNSYDFSTGVMSNFTGGDFYYLANNHGGQDKNKFLANNVGQRGLIDMGELPGIELKDIPVPSFGYNQFGVPAVVNHKYVSLAQTGEEGHYIIFEVINISDTYCAIEWLYK